MSGGAHRELSGDLFSMPLSTAQVYSVKRGTKGSSLEYEGCGVDGGNDWMI
ncbi:MAG: hypothetical protein ACFE9C_13475 [Candidatus Hodarchaeota archaeon]